MSDSLKNQEALLKAGKLATDYLTTVRECTSQDEYQHRVGTIIGFLLWYWKQQK